MARHDQVVTINCDNDSCFDALEITITDPARLEQQVQDYIYLNEWAEQTDGYFCSKHKWNANLAA